jgi:hypothetical protein
MTLSEFLVEQDLQRLKDPLNEQSSCVLILIFSIQFYECIALDRESTHPLENFFGFVRMDANDVNTAERMTASIVHTDVVKEALRVLELDEHVPGRANLAGVRLTGTPSPDRITYDVVMANPIGADTIAELCLKAVHAREGALNPDEQIGFLQFRNWLEQLQNPADESRLHREIAQRFILGSASRIVRIIVSHGAPHLQ